MGRNGLESSLKQMLRVALKWAGAWAVVGFVLGVLFMLGKTPPFAESGSSGHGIMTYFFWVPALGFGAAAAGLGIGVIYAVLMLVTEEWRLSFEQETPGAKGRLAPPVICGAAAGLIAGLLVGGITGALFFALLGAGSAGVLTHLEQRRTRAGAVKARAR